MNIDDLVATTANGKRQHKEEEKPELEPSELWLALTALPRPQREVPFPRTIPGTDKPIGTIIMWPLTQEEQHSANAEADRYTKKLLKDPQKKEEANLGYHHTFTNEIAVQVLHRACRDVRDTKRPAFPSTERMRQHMTTDELGVLFSTYCTVQSELGPIRAHLSKEEYEALILRIAEGGSTFPTDGLSWETQRALVLFMASQLVSFWTATCSLGKPPDVSSLILDMVRDLAAAKDKTEVEDARTIAEILDGTETTDEEG